MPGARPASSRSPKTKDPIEQLLKQIGTDDYYHIEAKPVGTKQHATTQEGQLSVDVAQTERDIVVVTTIAGVSPEDVELSVAPDMVTIRGHRTRAVSVEEHEFYLQECYWGAFSRTIVLPQEIDPSRTRALYKNGVLVVTLPKMREGKSIPIIVVEDD